ncbi:MAG TPA: hypothetical protein VFC90_12455 [Planctomycetota bacterium]|nr:hypothetical protein [Planctomycetota bacterium]
MAECDAPEAVPILCESVAELSRVDRDMVQHIGRLATSDQAALARALPSIVQATHAALERLGGSDGH